MIKVYSSDNSMQAGLVKSVLEDQGIACLVKNQNLSGALGEIPPLECWPEIWIMHEEDLALARQLVEATQASEITRGPAWICICGERIEGQFTACWSCGNEHTV